MDGASGGDGGDLPCPGCRGILRPHGHGRTRTVRGLGQSAITVTPRRARCGDCGATQILLPTALIARRADATEVIGNALVAKVKGAGSRPESTVRRWLRRVRGDHPEWLFWKGHEAAVTLDPTILDRSTYHTGLGDALNILAGAAMTYRKRHSVAESGVGLLLGRGTAAGRVGADRDSWPPVTSSHPHPRSPEKPVPPGSAAPAAHHHRADELVAAACPGPLARHHADDQTVTVPTNTNFFVRTVRDANIRTVRDG